MDAMLVPLSRSAKRRVWTRRIAVKSDVDQQVNPAKDQDVATVVRVDLSSNLDSRLCAIEVSIQSLLQYTIHTAYWSTPYWAPFSSCSEKLDETVWNAASRIPETEQLTERHSEWWPLQGE